MAPTYGATDGLSVSALPTTCPRQRRSSGHCCVRYLGSAASCPAVQRGVFSRTNSQTANRRVKGVCLVTNHRCQKRGKKRRGVRATFSPHFNIPTPATDAQLPEIERFIKAAVSDVLSAHGNKAPPPPELIPISENVSFLFATRYNLEKELRRIGETRQLFAETRRPAPAIHLANALVQAELLEPRLAHAIREVYSVCSPAIHGKPVTDAQVSFARDVGQVLIAALQAIS